VFGNRVAWAKSHLKMAGPLEAPKRGAYKITQRRLEAVGPNPSFIKGG
jgi:restriction system protein